jgi:cell division septation protein DedD
MSEDVLTDDQSHYEISLTAGQAFVAFVLLLLSLAVTFAFGLVIGKTQPEDRVIARKEPAAVIAEQPKKVEQTVSVDDFQAPAKIEETTSSVGTGFSRSEPAKAGSHTEAEPVKPKPAPTTPAYAQLLTTSDQKIAEGLAAKLIDSGFNAAYVERTTTDKGVAYRVRVKFPTDSEARAAEPKLRAFAPEVWITR